MKIISFILAIILAAPIPISVQAASWDQARGCLNAGEFDCAFDEARLLLKDGQVAVGNDHRTTDSMTFLQLAFVEAMARADVTRASDMTVGPDGIMMLLGRQPQRLPFTFGFLLLAMSDRCGDANCSDDFLGLYCKVSTEIPPATWRPLEKTNPLTIKGQSYFDSVMLKKPTCEES